MKAMDVDATVLARRAKIVAALRSIVPGEGVIEQETGRRPYESDGLTAYRALPMVVVLPDSVAQVRAVLAYCHENNVKVVPRGAGTSLSGGALPLADGVLLSMMKFNKIKEIDFANRFAIVEPGVTNLAITRAVEAQGFYYAPDPSSQIACSIGGNVAENSGGVHCLKYGLTTNNVLGCEMVLMTGEVIRLGGRHLDQAGYDLLALVIGSEGMLGVVTEVTVRILRGTGICPRVADCIRLQRIGGGLRRRHYRGRHYSGRHGNDGQARDRGGGRFCPCRLSARGRGAFDCRARRPPCRGRSSCWSRRKNRPGAWRRAMPDFRLRGRALAFWAGRKAAFPAVGRLSPDYYCMDGTIPRKELAKVLSGMRKLSERHGLRVANVFHAGDGNLHPLILYDANKPGELTRAENFGADILRLCVAVGGVLTGEHGVGVEKRDLMPEMFNDIDLAQQIAVKSAFDEKQLLNPGKVFPVLHRCAELGRMHVHGGELPFPDIPRF